MRPNNYEKSFYRVITNPGVKFLLLNLALFLLIILGLLGRSGRLPMETRLVSGVSIFIFSIVLVEALCGLIYLNVRYSRVKKTIICGYAVRDTYQSVNAYIGKRVLIPYWHQFLYFVYKDDCLAIYSGYSFDNPVFVLPYDMIDSISYVDGMKMDGLGGELPGVKILLGARAVTETVSDNAYVLAPYEGDLCEIYFGLVRGGSYLFMRMSQEESYKRFEEFRDKVMEMKRLNGAG